MSAILYTDLKSLYNCLVRWGTTQEKRLMIDIDGDTNPADATIKVKLRAVGWVKQTDSASAGIDLYYTEPAAKALVAGEPIAIFYPGDEKSWLAGSTV